MEVMLWSELLLLFEVVFLHPHGHNSLITLIWFDSLVHGTGARMSGDSGVSTDRAAGKAKSLDVIAPFFLNVFAFLSLSTFLFSSRVIKPYFPFWKLYVCSLFYCRLKAGALEGYQLINKLQASHLVIKLFHWSIWTVWSQG